MTPAQAQTQATPPVLLIPNQTQKLWAHFEVMKQPMDGTSPQEAWLSFEHHGSVRLNHEQEQVGGLIPLSHWARFKGINDSDLAQAKVLVYPATTQDEVQVWRHHPQGQWQRLERSDQKNLSWFGGSPYPHWHLNLAAHESVELLIWVNGHNRVRFPLLLMEPVDHLQLEKQSVAAATALITVPLVLVLVSFTYWPKRWQSSLALILAMALSECVGMLWVSGLGPWLMPWWDRWFWGQLGQTVYIFMLSLGVLHVWTVIRAQAPRWLLGLLWIWMVWWWFATPWLAHAYPWSPRFQLVWTGTAQSVVLLLVALWAYRRWPSMGTRQLVLIWLIYVMSAVIYALHRWLDWSVQVTLWANVAQGSAVACVFAVAIWQQVMTLRDEERMQMERLHQRQLWWAMLQHDLWQPLRSIRVCVEGLMSRPQSDADELLLSLKHATDSLDDFAYAHRPHSARQHSAQMTTLVDLQALVRQITFEHRPMANRLSVSLSHHLLPLWAHINEAELRRLVRNLLHNALRHTPEGGRIVLALRKRQGMASLWVMDTGAGMSDDVLKAHVHYQHALRASEQLWLAEELPHLQTENGWGLGLYSVHQIARMQGWHLEFKSNLGRGTTVRIGLGPASLPQTHIVS